MPTSTSPHGKDFPGRKDALRPNRRILVITSGGGHWVQALRLRRAFVGFDVAFGTVHRHHDRDVTGCRFYVVPDSNRNTKLKLLWSALVVLTVIIRERPAVVISTGAAPGGLALFFAKKFGARTAWIDSIANAETLSLSGQKAGRYADLWLTQWPHLAQVGGPDYSGTVL